MSPQLRAELLKIRTTRTTLGLAAGMVLLVLLFALLGGLLIDANELARADNQRTILAAGQAATLFAALVGIMLVTSEFRHGTIRPTLLYQPRRPLLLAAKLAAGLLAGLAFGIVAEGLALGIGLAVMAGRGVDRAVGGGELVHLSLGTVAVTGLWAAIGVAVGAIVRHQVGAIVGLLAYLFVAENLLFGLVPHVGRYLPGPSGQALAGDTTTNLLPAGTGAAILVGYVLALAAAGIALTQRRDVD